MNSLDFLSNNRFMWNDKYTECINMNNIIKIKFVNENIIHLYYSSNYKFSEKNSFYVINKNNGWSKLIEYFYNWKKYESEKEEREKTDRQIEKWRRKEMNSKLLKCHYSKPIYPWDKILNNNNQEDKKIQTDNNQKDKKTQTDNLDKKSPKLSTNENEDYEIIN